MKKLLIVVLFITTVIETYLGLGVLLKPESLMASFGVAEINSDVRYMAAIIGWFCVVVSALAAQACYWVWKNRAEGITVAIWLALFWIGIGLHLGFGFDRPQHLVLDTAKGFLILCLAFIVRSK